MEQGSIKYITVDGKLYRATIIPMPLVPFTEDGKFDFGEGVYMVQNTGEHACFLTKNKYWTLFPGGTFSIGVGSDFNIAKIDWYINFHPDVIADGCIHVGRRLEVMELKICEQLCKL